MDFRTKVARNSFGVRVSALMVKDHKIYLAKTPKEAYYLLGGAILVNEMTEEAIKREVHEELGIDVVVGQLAFVVENQFALEGIDYHQIEFHYFVTPLTEPNSEIEEGDQIRQCEWISLDSLDSVNLNPAFLKTELKNWNGQVKHIVNRNEEKTI